MRREPTEPEARLWRHLSNSQLGGFKFRRQTVIGPFICDFSCSHNGLVIEIDGHTHVAEDDLHRDTVLNNLGYHVTRFTNADVMGNIDGVLQAILRVATRLPERRYKVVTDPPQPLPWKGGA